VRLVTHSQLKNLCNGNALYVDNLVIRNMREKHSLLSSIIIINIIAFGAYPTGYNCIVIYHVLCYFNWCCEDGGSLGGTRENVEDTHSRRRQSENQRQSMLGE